MSSLDGDDDNDGMAIADGDDDADGMAIAEGDDDDDGTGSPDILGDTDCDTPGAGPPSSMSCVS